MDAPQDCAPPRESAACTFPGHAPLPSSGVHFGAGSATAAQVEVADPVALMAAVALLTPTQIEELNEAEAEAFVIACARVTSAVHARQSLAMDTLAGRVEERLERQRHEQPPPFGVPGADVHGTVASMLAPSLHCSTRAVGKRLEADRWLVCAAESTFSSQWQGDLERFRADVVADASADLDPALRETFEALVLETSLDEVTGELTLVSPEVRQLNRAELSRRARAVARELDPQSDERAARRAHGERRVVVTPDRRRPGKSRWHVLLPSQVSHEVFAVVDTLAGQYARAHPGTPIDGHRADAFADLVLGNAQVQTTVELVVPVLAAHGPDDGRVGAEGVAGTSSPAAPDAAPPSVARASAAGDPLEELAPLMARISNPGDAAVTDPAETTVANPADANPADANPADAGLTSSTTEPVRSTGEVHWVLPGSVDLPRHGELLPSAVAELLSRPETLVRLARLDPNGSIVQDPKTYRPSASLRRRLRSRDGTCRFPGCHTPAARCDLDHVVPYPAGLTEPTNLISLCRTHHRFKHHGGWRAVLRPDATVAWTVPDGRTHVDRPRPLRITRDLDLTDHADSQVAFDVRRGWVPGLPVGMSMDDLAQQEALLPDEPP
ncbi:HNH endonuclease signature motif containing protein [Pedococcus sp. KACC 23699]|uniref:HNH endonuclease signature motif containing protein n=1 Tax=Pedococcus sp. KACC 23699 TaxID=3149228 RepID=A0AAU7JUD9_9MICO